MFWSKGVVVDVIVVIGSGVGVVVVVGVGRLPGSNIGWKGVGVVVASRGTPTRVTYSIVGIGRGMLSGGMHETVNASRRIMEAIRR